MYGSTMSMFSSVGWYRARSKSTDCSPLGGLVAKKSRDPDMTNLIM